MQAKVNYKKILIEEIRELPGDVIPQVLKIIRSLKESINLGAAPTKKDQKFSGLCGIWKDPRSAEEIMEDIRKHRTGFAGREIGL